jgi:hypothetical protein
VVDGSVVLYLIATETIALPEPPFQLVLTLCLMQMTRIVLGAEKGTGMIGRKKGIIINCSSAAGATKSLLVI